MFEIGRVSRTRPHLLADTAEIALAFGGYCQISATDLASIMKMSPTSASELLSLDEPDLDDNNENDDLDGAELNAKEQGYIDEAIRQIQFRAVAFGSAYPFLLEGDILTLSKRLTLKRRIYLLLLACSRTRSFKEKGAVQRLADAFENISAEVLRRILPEKGEVFMFGPNSEDRRKKFSTNLLAAIPILAKRIGMRLKYGWEKNYTSSGDGKIDLVGVYDFDNRARGLHVILAQCAAMEDEKDWQKKRLEAKIESHMATYDYIVAPQAVLFVPGCYRQPDGEWVNSNNVSGVLTIDRLRIISILNYDSSIRDLIDGIFKKIPLKVAA